MKSEYIKIFAIMPSEIYKTKDLTSEEKLIAERITALCKKEGFAWITNKSLADMYGIREDTVSKHIKHLIEYGYIKCIYGKNDHGNKKRTIYLSNNIWADGTIIGSTNNQTDVGYNSKYNIKENNIREYKSNTPDWFDKVYEKKIPTPEEQQEFEDLLKEFE